MGLTALVAARLNREAQRSSGSVQSLRWLNGCCNAAQDARSQRLCGSVWISRELNGSRGAKLNRKVRSVYASVWKDTASRKAVESPD
jgi:hypothetical protein